MWCVDFLRFFSVLVVLSHIWRVLLAGSYSFSFRVCVT